MATVNEEKNVVEYRARDGSQIKLTPQIIKRYLVSGKSELVTDQELYIYMGLCKSRGLNPFIKDCYITKFSPGDPAAIITSIDYYRKRARAQKDCKGWTYGIIILGDKGQPVYRNGCLLLDGETLIGGWAEATPEGWSVPMRKEVNLKRYIKRKHDGSVTRFWSPDNQPEQIAKVAESQMLRSVWPDEFQGLYVDSEIQSRDAQEDLGAAVSTASPPDMRVFEDVFEAELSDPLWPAYMESIHKLYPTHEKHQIKADLLAQSDVIKSKLFPEWKAKSQSANKAAKPETTAAAPPADIKAPAETKTETTAPPADDFRSKWINLKEAGFSTFVFKNIDKFRALEGEALAEAVAKWKKIYVSFPVPFVANPAEPQQQASGEAQGYEITTSSDGTSNGNMETELERLKAEIRMHDRTNREAVKAAMQDTGITLPTTIDGCRVVLEAITARLK